MPKIHSIRQNDVNESKSSSFQPERSHLGTVNSLTKHEESESICRPPLVKQFYSGRLKSWLPWSLHPNQLAEAPPQVNEVQAEADKNVDIRPHLFDPVLGQTLLCDSGSQVSAFPPEPGDQPLPHVFLKAANGSRMACFGKKTVSIKIGRKPYQFEFIKAQVESPIIGWDFMKHHKLDLRWNENEQITIYDKKANISAILEFKEIPLEKSVQLKNLSLITSEAGGHLDRELINPEVLAGEVAAVQALDPDEAAPHDEDINIVPEGPYKQILAQFPNLLKQNFHAEPTKSNIIHRIHTNGPPVRAKTRRLLPGSEKAIKAKQAWDELINLGIVEKVDPSAANTYCSPLHFAPKADGFLRPVGDFRA